MRDSVQHQQGQGNCIHFLISYLSLFMIINNHSYIQYFQDLIFKNVPSVSSYKEKEECEKYWNAANRQYQQGPSQLKPFHDSMAKCLPSDFRALPCLCCLVLPDTSALPDMAVAKQSREARYKAQSAGSCQTSAFTCSLLRNKTWSMDSNC